MAINPIQEKVQKVSLKSLYYAVMTDEVTETYGTVKQLTRPIELTLTPNFSSGTFDAGDQVAAYETALDSIGISGQVADLPSEVQADWYGHKLSSVGGVIMSTEDKPPYIAFGFVSGSKFVWTYKAKFMPSEVTDTTKRKGEIAYKQQGFSGEAIPLNDGTVKHTVRTDDAGVTVTEETFFASVEKPTVPAGE